MICCINILLLFLCFADPVRVDDGRGSGRYYLPSACKTIYATWLDARLVAVKTFIAKAGPNTARAQLSAKLAYYNENDIFYDFVDIDCEDDDVSSLAELIPGLESEYSEEDRAKGDRVAEYLGLLHPVAYHDESGEPTGEYYVRFDQPRKLYASSDDAAEGAYRTLELHLREQCRLASDGNNNDELLPDRNSGKSVVAGDRGGVTFPATDSVEDADLVGAGSAVGTSAGSSAGCVVSRKRRKGMWGCEDGVGASTSCPDAADGPSSAKRAKSSVGTSGVGRELRLVLRRLEDIPLQAGLGPQGNSSSGGRHCATLSPRPPAGGGCGCGACANKANCGRCANCVVRHLKKKCIMRTCCSQSIGSFAADGRDPRRNSRGWVAPRPDDLSAKNTRLSHKANCRFYKCGAPRHPNCCIRCGASGTPEVDLNVSYTLRPCAACEQTSIPLCVCGLTTLPFFLTIVKPSPDGEVPRSLPWSLEEMREQGFGGI